MNLLIEKAYPYLLGITAGVIWHATDSIFPNGDSIISATLSVSGILVGFLSTSKAILISLNTKILTDLQTSEYNNILVSYISQAIWINLAFCVLNVIGYFEIQSKKWYATIWIIFAIMALTTFIRVTHIMMKIFKQN